MKSVNNVSENSWFISERQKKANVIEDTRKEGMYTIT